MQEKNLNHCKFKIGSIPLIDQVLKKLNFRSIFNGFIKNDRYIEGVEVLLKSMLIEPSALYRIPKWATQFEPKKICEKKLGDDLLGRTLDKLFSIDRATLLTKLTVNAVSSYNIDTSTIHNDSTSIKFYGEYKAQSRKSIKLKHGHSKDHRPDLKQLVYNLSITEDGAIPVHFKCHDGNKTDDILHIETWLTLRGILARSDFLYVADSKLCTSNNMRKIDREGGKFVTIVPDTRSETKIFGEECYESDVRWLPLTRRESTRKKGKYNVFQVAEGFYQLSEGFRMFWYRSSEKRQRDEDGRKDRIEKVLEKLSDLKDQRKRGPKSEKTLMKNANKIIEHYKATKWIFVEVRTREEERYKKSSRGRPTSEATYRRTVNKIPYLVIIKNHEGIARSESTDGIFPLTTNAGIDAKTTLQAYKYQPYLEKRFSWMKSDYEIAPVFLKKTERVEALMFIGYLSDVVAAIIQRELRNAMKANGIPYLQTLPEERPSKTPTWEQLQRLFAQHSKYILKDGQKHIKTFWDELTPHQEQVLSLLKIPRSEFVG